MRFLLLLQLIYSSWALPVFTFNGSLVSAAPPSYAFLDKELHLPDNFILCLSLKQARFDDVGFISVAGNDSREWMKMKVETHFKTTRLNIHWNGNFHKIGKLKNPRIDFWYHICLKINIQEYEIKVALNGELIGRVHEENMSNTPNSLKMDIGKEFHTKQFQGSVGNIEVFPDGNLTDLSSSPCKRSQEALLIWIPRDWKIVGSELSLTEDFENTFCNISDDYNLAIPFETTFKEGAHICLQKLNNSNISFEQDRDLFLKYVAWH